MRCEVDQHRFLPDKNLCWSCLQLATHTQQLKGLDAGVSGVPMSAAFPIGDSVPVHLARKRAITGR